VFAHGETLAEAVQAAEDKLFDDMPEDERIAAFWGCHEQGVKYPAADFFAWHHRLTGSCEMGRKSFAADHGIDLDNDTYTVEEFVKMWGEESNAANDCIIEILSSYMEFISLARFAMLATTNPELQDGERKRAWRTFKKIADDRKAQWESVLAHAQAAKELANGN
jgi:hypothetical protein